MGYRHADDWPPAVRLLRRCYDVVRRTVCSGADHPAALPLITLFMLAFGWIAWHNPHGNPSDSFAIWNLHARLMAFAPQELFNPALEYSHLDYPPLIPALIALIWRVTGWQPIVPILLNGAVWAALLWMLRRQIWALLLAGTVLVMFAASQYADIPLALCLLIASASYFKEREAAVGIALGVGALVKNEGLLMLAAFFVVWMVLDRRVPWRAVLAALPLLVMLAAYKSVVPPNDVIGAADKLGRLLDARRYLVIGQYVSIYTAVRFGFGAIPLSLLAWLTRDQRPGLSVPLIAVLVIWLGYIGIYVITPHDLVWHLTTSYDRLLAQLFPAWLLALSAVRG